MTESMIRVKENGSSYILVLNIPAIRFKAQLKKYIDLWISENIKNTVYWEYTDFNPYSFECEIEHLNSWKGKFVLFLDVPISENDVENYLDRWISTHFKNTDGFSVTYP